jgi:pilus assembly protein Flp/PilA
LTQGCAGNPLNPRTPFATLAFLCQGAFLMIQLFRRLLNDECGQDLIEYALIAALIAIIAITGLNGLASKINSEYTKIGTSL